MTHFVFVEEYKEEVKALVALDWIRSVYGEQREANLRLRDHRVATSIRANVAVAKDRWIINK